MLSACTGGGATPPPAVTPFLVGRPAHPCGFARPVLRGGGAGERAEPLRGSGDGPRAGADVPVRRTGRRRPPVRSSRASLPLRIPGLQLALTGAPAICLRRPADTVRATTPVGSSRKATGHNGSRKSRPRWRAAAAPVGGLPASLSHAALPHARHGPRGLEPNSFGWMLQARRQRGLRRACWSLLRLFYWLQLIDPSLDGVSQIAPVFLLSVLQMQMQNQPTNTRTRTRSSNGARAAAWPQPGGLCSLETRVPSRGARGAG